MSSRTSVGALPTQPTIGLLAQLRRATACRAEGRGSNARTGRHFTRHDRDAREEDSNPPRLGRGETRGGTEARDQFHSAPVAEKIIGIRLLNGTTQVQLLPGVAFPDDVKVACPPVKRIVVVRVHVGEIF